jgi:peptide/nickel transport system permease protein
MKIVDALSRKNKIYEELGIDGELSSTSLYNDAWKRLKKNKAAIISLIIIIVLTFVAIFADFISPYSPEEQDIANKLQKPSSEHLLGTDHLGRDILSRIIYGSRVSLSVGIVAESIAVIIGIIMGSLAGFYGGKVDYVISIIIEVFASFPFILFAIAVMFVLGPGVINVFIAIGVIGWTSLARLIRGQVMQLKEKEYIEAAKASGSSNFRTIIKHVIPNCLSTIIVIVTLHIPGDIMTEATLSFLGLGVQPPMPSWGGMISNARKFMRQAPTYSLFPGIAIMLVVLSFNTLGDGLRDALDPKLKNL